MKKSYLCVCVCEREREVSLDTSVVHGFEAFVLLKGKNGKEKGDSFICFDQSLNLQLYLHYPLQL